jgi:hypothetical protein
MGKAEGRYSQLVGFVVFLCVFGVVAGTSWADRFVDNLDGTVSDTKTGLMWQQADSGNTTLTWEEAQAYCESLVLPSLGGYSDWRAPRIDELETIVDYSRFDPAAFDPPFVTRSERWGNGYWSGSNYGSDPAVAWSVWFYYGDSGWAYKTRNYYYVRCVRGGPFWPFDPSTDFQTPAGKPGVVLDTWWGYMWQQGDSGDTTLTWEEAKAYCKSLVLPGPDGYTDWQLPEIEALGTIVNYTTKKPALSEPFDPRRSDNYWSGTTNARVSDGAWYLSFTYGSRDWYFTTDVDVLFYVRCVRGGPESMVPLTLDKTGTGTGGVTSDPVRIDCGTSCPTQSANFAELTQITLTAEADRGSIFVGWDGGGCSGAGPCQLTMGTDPTTVTAQFDRSAAVPALSPWGVTLFTVLTAASTILVLRRRRTDS